MVAIYVWNVGWVCARKNGKNVYTKWKQGAKPYTSEYEKEFIAACRQAEQEGHHVDKVHVRRFIAE